MKRSFLSWNSSKLLFPTIDLTRNCFKSNPKSNLDVENETFKSFWKLPQANLVEILTTSCKTNPKHMIVFHIRPAYEKKRNAPTQDWTADLQFTRLALYHWAIEAGSWIHADFQNCCRQSIFILQNKTAFEYFEFLRYEKCIEEFSERNSFNENVWVFISWQTVNQKKYVNIQTRVSYSASMYIVDLCEEKMTALFFSRHKQNVKSCANVTI